jgi:hypothetical protein
MQTIDNIPLKNFDGLFEIIHLFEDTNKITCKLLNAKPLGFYSRVVIRKIEKNNDFRIVLTISKTTNSVRFWGMETEKIEYLIIEIKGNHFKIENAFICNIEESFGTNFKNAKVTAQFNELIKIQNNVDFHFQRLIIPCEKDIFFPFYFEDARGYKTEEKVIMGLIPLLIDSQNFETFKHIKEISSIKRSYLIIDSINEMTLEVFQNYVYSILIGFGYITGCFLQNLGFYFSYDKYKKLQGIQIQGKRKSVYTFLSPIYKNPYGVFQNKDYHDKYCNIIRGVKSSEISKLCHLINSSQDFMVIILLILESCAVTQIIQPAGFAVALEGFSAFIKKELEKETEKKSPKLSSKILGDLKKILKDNEEELGEAFALFYKKIEQINQPTNKDTLLKPFEYLKIPISDTDKETIAHRNDLLHGRYDLKSTFESESNQNYRFLISTRLYTLLSALIMKYIGFDNMIINYPKKYEYLLNITSDEEPFRQI